MSGELLQIIKVQSPASLPLNLVLIQGKLHYPFKYGVDLPGCP